jgi:hypothetical protein
LLIVPGGRESPEADAPVRHHDARVGGLREWLLSEGSSHVPIYAIQEGELEIVVAKAQHVKKDSSDPCYPLFSDNLTYPIPVSRLDRSKTVVVLWLRTGQIGSKRSKSSVC